MTSGKVEIVTIGDELLLGFTVDSNAAHIARELGEIGWEVVRRATVGDRPDAIESAVHDALARTGGVITTGGLGPTADDLSKAPVARLFGRKLLLDETVLNGIRKRWERLFPGRHFPAPNRTQAEIPEGARILENRHGTAPGIWLDDPDGRWVAMLPGVPREMRGMLAEELLPILKARSGDRVVLSRTLRTTGIGESAIAEILGAAPLDGVAISAKLTLAYLPSPLGVDLRLTSRGAPRPTAMTALESAALKLREQIAPYVYGEDDADLAAVVLELCRQKALSVAVAESCTGGMLGQRLTAVPGSSDVFLGGVIAYHDDVKRELLDVAPATLRDHGAVSVETALEMARSVRKRLRSGIGIAITGVAGPGGGTPQKPVGTVCIAIDAGAQRPARAFRLIGDRNEIRLRSVQAALDMLRRALQDV